MAAVREIIAIILCIALMAVSTSARHTSAKQQRRVTLTFYLNIGVNKNYVQMANVTSSTGENMVLHSAGLPVKSGSNASTAALVGHARGLTLETSAGDSGGEREQIFLTVEYSNGKFNGTLAFHGQIHFPPVDGDEVAVVGGTGDFRRVTGYAVPTLLSSLMSDPLVLRYKVHLVFPFREC